MKNFLLVLCLLCCHIIVSECSLQEVAERFEIPVVLMIECTDRAGISEPELLQYFSDSNISFKDWRRTDFIGKVGCFLFCIHEKEGLMTGTIIHIEKLIGAMSSIMDMNSEKGVRMQKAMEECGENVKGKQDPCEVALVFRECVHSIMRS
ncbi:pheromone-binding protein Gp-9-like [Hylaeus volcanicus]|uniref:pheromone-binding protein Gp-9-like n=1 Tax=Hylaeus volcanicus TaxID=313075 RepID=UPI0023B795F9|nr:pheromone-binding protein Gp-9-like [Hylaeus volcanicus]